MKRLNTNTITEGLEALGRKLPQDRKFQILILGGAAGVLSGELPGIHTTGDVLTLFIFARPAIAMLFSTRPRR